MNKLITHSIIAAVLAAGTFGGVGSSVSAAPAAETSGTSRALVQPVLAPFDLQAMRQVLSGLPNSQATAALVYVGTPAESWLGAAGVSDIKTNAPVRADGRFRIGSITKVFTAAAVLQLVAENKVDLNRSIQHYLPGLLPADIPPVTVGQLLNHTSGLPSPDLPEGVTEEDLQHLNWTPGQVVEQAFRDSMEFEPGTKQHYTNINYFLAGMLIEEVTGNPYEVEIYSRIVQPLSMLDTYLPGSDTRIIGPHAHGYQAVEHEGQTELLDVTEGNQSFTWAAGQMISTTTDLNTFMTALFSGKLLPEEQLEYMFTVPDVPTWDEAGKDAGPAVLSMGMTRMVIKGYTFWGKTGARPGYGNGMFATRDLQRRLVYSINSTDAKGAGQNMLGIQIGMLAFGLK
ncbi:MAG: peptidase [Paenibacillus sp.]|nr:peptidase [Paenibacillus sp.]